MRRRLWSEREKGRQGWGLWGRGQSWPGPWALPDPNLTLTLTSGLSWAEEAGSGDSPPAEGTLLSPCLPEVIPIIIHTETLS